MRFAMENADFTSQIVATINGPGEASGWLRPFARALRQRDSRIRVIRESVIIGDYAIDSLKREKDDAREVRQGYECGIKLANFNDLKEGDILEDYRIEEIRRTL